MITVQLDEQAAHTLGALAQRPEEHLARLGDERVAQPPVGHLAGESEVAGLEEWEREMQVNVDCVRDQLEKRST